MESTGVYWKPICYVLEDAFTCVLANAAQIALVPGRKTDVKDCAWIAQLLEHRDPDVLADLARGAESSRRCAKPWPGAFGPIMPFWSVKCSPTSTTSTK